MKKKEYTKPQIEVMEYTPTQLICTSSEEVIQIPFSDEVIDAGD